MFTLRFTNYFLKKEKKLTKNNPTLKKLVQNTLESLQKNPKNKALKSHKITRENGEKSISSFVSGDIRIIWDYSSTGRAYILDILDIGGHSGKNKVYK